MATDENRGYKFYRELLKSPKYILAPMVDASEYPFRELCREFIIDQVDFVFFLNQPIIIS